METTRDAIKHLVELRGLRLDAEHLANLAQQMEAIYQAVDAFGVIDVVGVEPPLVYFVAPRL